jgi:uncharacterized protein (DUF4415 family)
MRHFAQFERATQGTLDEDVLDFFRHGGVGYQRRMNAVLRSYMTEVAGKKRA